MKIKSLLLPLSLFGAFFLVSCEGTKDQLGLTKQSPDEFQVVKRAPLALPPNYALRPPAPGAARPQEQTTSETAAQAVFGGTAPAEVAPDGGEDLLLFQTGAQNADPNIRRTVDTETAEFVDENQPVIEKLMNITGSDETKSSVVDPEKEAERLRENAQSGKPVTEGETPSKVK